MPRLFTPSLLVLCLALVSGRPRTSSARRRCTRRRGPTGPRRWWPCCSTAALTLNSATQQTSCPLIMLPRTTSSRARMSTGGCMTPCFEAGPPGRKFDTRPLGRPQNGPSVLGLARSAGPAFCAAAWTRRVKALARTQQRAGCATRPPRRVFPSRQIFGALATRKRPVYGACGARADRLAVPIRRLPPPSPACSRRVLLGQRQLPGMHSEQRPC